MKKIILIITLLFCFSFSVSAEDSYKEQYNASGAEQLYDLFPEETRRIIDDMEIDISDSAWVNKLEPENIFAQIADFFKTGIKKPMTSGLGMLAVIIFIAVCSTFDSFKAYSQAASFVFVICFCAGMLGPLFSLIESCSSAVKGISTLISGFVPVYAGIITVSGQGLTASGMSFLLLFAAGAISALSSFVIVPLMSCYLGIGVAGSVTDFTGVGRLGETIKKAAMWILSFALTIFLGLLTIQTSVNAAADNLGVRAAKFMLGSFVPTFGGALSETLTTLLGSVKLLKSSVGMFGVVGIALIVIPVIIELLCWRLTLFLLDASAELLGVKVKTGVIKAADSVLAVLIGVLLFCGALFIISLAVVSGR